MKAQERRRNKRLRLNCSATVQSRLGTDLSIEAVAENVSPTGAFLKTDNWQSFQVDDRAVLTFFLPPDFTGQHDTIGLQGSAVVTRVDEDNQGVGVEFVKSFRQFEPLSVPELPGKFRYKKLAYYLSSLADRAPEEFTASYPNGFLVERAERFFDQEVIFQFITEVAEDHYVLEQLRQGALHKEVLEARVIEIGKRKGDVNSEVVSLGRAPDNDIVLYNKLVSRSHAKLYLPPSGHPCSLEDTGSTNGTYVNGRQLVPQDKYHLRDGDHISFGPETKVIFFSAKAFHNFLAGLKTVDH